MAFDREELLKKLAMALVANPGSTMQELADSAVVLRFVAEVGEADIYSGARLLNHDIFLAMKDLGIECPFTQVDVHNK